MRRQLLILRIATERLTQLGPRRLEAAFEPTSAARRRIHGAQRVEHRSPHALGREGFERHTRRRPIPPGGVEQSDNAFTDELVDFDLRRQPPDEAHSHLADQRQVVDHESVALCIRSVGEKHGI